ncbi:MAG: alpha/beta fold hydrolase [bacterium]
MTLVHNDKWLAQKYMRLHPGWLVGMAFAFLVLGVQMHAEEGTTVSNQMEKSPYRHHNITLPDGGKLAYHVRPGEGPCLVLIPGSWGDYRVYDQTVASLSSALRVVIVELRGHGDSWPPTLDGSIELFAEDVLRVVDTLNLRRFYVGGHSIGGMIAIEAAGRRPEAVAGAISIEGWTHYQVQKDAFGHVTGTTLSATQEEQRMANRARVRDRLTDEQIASFASIWRRWDGYPILATTTVPILELWGDRGHPCPDRKTMRIPDRVNINLVWFENASHSLLIEKPAAVAGQINAFVQRIESERPSLPDPSHMFAVPKLNLTTGTPDFSGLPRLECETITIFRGIEHEAGFNMHPYIAYFDGRFWAMWSCNRIRDLQAGQHVRYATSTDGVNWTTPEPIMLREDDGMRYFARGFWIRDGELVALAAYDEAVRPLFGPGLELRGYRWNGASNGWNTPIVIADDTINNFPPKRLPSGDWMMSRRNHRMEKSMLVGGVIAPNDWSAIAIPVPADGAKLDEPFWWVLPNGALSAVFRDGSKSRRLYRAFSTDEGRTWTTPVKTDFPDATAKFNVLRLSNGHYVMASNPSPDGVRNPLCLSLSDDGIVFTQMAVLRDTPTVYRYAGKDPGYAGYHYPHLLEHGDYLYIVHAENMEDIVLLRTPIEELNRIRTTSD